MIIIVTPEIEIPTNAPLKEVRICETISGFRIVLRTAILETNGKITGNCHNSWNSEEATIESFLEIKLSKSFVTEWRSDFFKK